MGGRVSYTSVCKRVKISGEKVELQVKLFFYKFPTRMADFIAFAADFDTRLPAVGTAVAFVIIRSDGIGLQGFGA